MANLDLHFDAKRRNRRQMRSRAGKWSARRTIAFALLASGALWAMIFWIASTLLV
jgi:hypothetical protein